LLLLSFRLDMHDDLSAAAMRLSSKRRSEPKMFKLTLGMVFRVERYLIIHLFRRDNVPCEWMK
jgi:hypothetical protein